MLKRPPATPRQPPAGIATREGRRPADGPRPGAHIGAETLASSAYARLRRDVITGELEPGQKLNIRSLCDKFQMGLAPIREALNRLTSEGFVVVADQRGFTVSSLSRQDLAELLKTRRWLYEIGLREAISHGDRAWEEQIVLAHHWLVRTPRAPEGDASGWNPAWIEAHRAFHASLISACGSRWLIAFCDQMFDASERYRILARKAVAYRPEPSDQEHRKLVEAAIERRPDEAVSLMNAHLDRTADFIDSLFNPPPKAQR